MSSKIQHDRRSSTRFNKVKFGHWQAIATILATFVAWKIVLLLLALGSVIIGPDYDTSTSLTEALDTPSNLDPPSQPSADSFHEQRPLGHFITTVCALLARALNRWDGLYYTSAALHGYVYEQDWAFGPGIPYTVRFLLQHVFHRPISPLNISLTAIAVANASHLASVLVLYALVRNLFGGETNRLALLTSILHILSPAGLFLSAPYAESSTALLSFTAYWLVSITHKPLSSSRLGSKSSATSLLTTTLLYARNGACLLLAGLALAVATGFRSNAILGGFIFMGELASYLCQVYASGSSPSALFAFVGGVLPSLIAGIVLGIGSLLPQVWAIYRYCPTVSVPFLGNISLQNPTVQSEPLPWCTRTIPSIYTFVQEEYWDVGFLRYWTLPNLPLFLLAAPVLTFLLVSGVSFSRQYNPLVSLAALTSRNQDEKARAIHRKSVFVFSLAIQQVVLGTLAIAVYHIQIISRISSAYPLWYVWIARGILSPPNHTQQAPRTVSEKEAHRVGSYVRAIIMFMVLYAGIQGVLFSSFLPPA